MGVLMMRRLLLLGAFFVALLVSGHGYQRPPPREMLIVPNSDDSTPASPQQVHVSIVGEEKMRVSWITEADSESLVKYGTSPGVYDLSSYGSSSSYRYLLYKSGQIHDVVIGPLKPNSVYYYRLGGSDVVDATREFSFRTPPSLFPITFSVVGDLGQTGWTNSTLQHIKASDYDMLLLPGDLSYADYLQNLWDSFGRLVEPLASQRPWMVTQGNHEMERIPVLHPQPFKAYNARWRMPFRESGSDSNLYYSFDVAGVHVLMLASYADFDPDSAQYRWLQADLAKVDREKTPWLFALVHAPWYNSNTAHQGEGDAMRDAVEELLYEARVDAVFAGHVHAYERFTRVYRGKADSCGPVHVTVGDGGNKEGLATKYIDPKPEISEFREASFGHGRLQVVNQTHAKWSWHRNDDDAATESDLVWLNSLSSEEACKKIT
ncbi:hypothetical protein H6P81_003461 [Aristolochia fimbriata]|uniref:Purple acid phosphatase n=1 Tax=Aristolochia fimbriata TaxID=158543 RepID=A0AAV7FDF3_ARIFI|nr:hypothetical protein H6P81_003461 [Aristolochia fimbriata]